MSSLLVPLDGSPLAEESVPWAALLARHSSRPVRLLGVYGYDVQLWEVAGIDPRSDIAEARGKLEGYLGRVAGQSAFDGVTVATEVRAGDVATEIAACAGECAAGLIVITSRGAGGRARGSVADRLMRTSTLPVLVVPTQVRPKPAIDGLLVPLDGSPLAHCALGVAREIAQTAGARLHLLHVVDAGFEWAVAGGPPPGLVEALERNATSDLQSVATGEDITAVRHGKVVDTVLEYAEEQSCQLIVMATHGRGGRARLDLGSTADALLRAADRPIVVVPAR